MRKTFCKSHICDPKDGSLNMRYFKVKKGFYRGKDQIERLADGVVEHGATSHKLIQQEFLPEWTLTEIRLRICKLFRTTDLSQYAQTEFKDKEHILNEASKNKKLQKDISE